MHLRRSWLVVCVLAAYAGQAAVVYKWKDENGVIHYSDQPVPGAEKIYTASSPSPKSGSTAAGRTSAAGGAQTRAKAPGQFERIAITSPAPEQAFFGDEIISVSLILEPAPKPTQVITWMLNSKPIDDQPPNTTHFTLQNLPRGAYTIAATVTDQASGESQSTATISFFVRQPSMLEPLRKKG